MATQKKTAAPQQSLEQERAKKAWDFIGRVREENKKEYGSLARGAPADIQLNGLGQTLAFWRAKGFKKGDAKHNAEDQLLEHVSDWLIMPERGLAISNDERYSGNKVLYWISHTATSEQYRRATAEALAFLIWLKRFAEAEFGGES